MGFTRSGKSAGEWLIAVRLLILCLCVLVAQGDERLTDWRFTVLKSLDTAKAETHRSAPLIASAARIDRVRMRFALCIRCSTRAKRSFSNSLPVVSDETVAR